MKEQKRRFSFFVEIEEIKKFVENCKKIDTDAAKELRKFIRRFNKKIEKKGS
jgi:L-lactate utilization protein LutB